MGSVCRREHGLCCDRASKDITNWLLRLQQSLLPVLSIPAAGIMHYTSDSTQITPGKQGRHSRFSLGRICGRPTEELPTPHFTTRVRCMTRSTAWPLQNQLYTLHTCVYSNHNVHMYFQNKVSILLLFVLITSYCVGSSTDPYFTCVEEGPRAQSQPWRKGKVQPRDLNNSEGDKR